MDDFLMSGPPPDVDAYAPEFCFCGERTVESHEFWFCSTKCARLDALLSLDDPECHYRNNVRKAYLQAGVPELYPRRMMSVDQLRSGPIAQRVVVNSLAPLSPPTNVKNNPTIIRQDAQDRHMVGFPGLSHVTGSILNERTPGGEAPVTGRHNYTRREIPPKTLSRTQNREESVDEEPLRDVVTIPEPAPARTLRRTPQSSNNLRSNIRKSVAALFNRSRKDNASGNPVNTIVPPVRKESLLSNRQPRNPPSAASASKSKVLRRSRSFAVRSPLDKRDTVMQIIEQMRGEMAGSLDPRSLFDNDEGY